MGLLYFYIIKIDAVPLMHICSINKCSIVSFRDFSFLSPTYCLTRRYDKTYFFMMENHFCKDKTCNIIFFIYINIWYKLKKKIYNMKQILSYFYAYTLCAQVMLGLRKKYPVLNTLVSFVESSKEESSSASKTHSPNQSHSPLTKTKVTLFINVVNNQ